MWHPDEYMESLYASITPELQFAAANAEEWKAWRDRLRRRFAERLGGFPDRSAALEPKLLERVECDGYVRERVEFTTFFGLRCPAYVLVPTVSAALGARLPAVAAFHGHGYGSREVVGLSPAGESIIGRPTYQKNFGVQLAKRGFLVVAPEIFGFGDRRLRDEYGRDKYSSCDKLSKLLLHMGRTMAGHRVYEAMRAVDYLCMREDVDAERIGCMGISGGGLVASFTAALDERIKSTVVSGYVNTFKASILDIEHCIDNYVPGLGEYAEMPDIVSLIAPRALLMEAGTKDEIFPLSASLEALERIRNVYTLLEVPSKLACDVFEGEHEISGAQAYDWLQRTV
ncbi:alpha/beta hydrolase family protein [Paenibacillus sp.]|uniref:alpha/beta hydrolase family protein n=1 Tax=Paenibacillus sp. TaxID=58172 RepID=UPI0028126EF3|nr:alpha/beta hydrolase family protein [Paenibacillus sp.]